MHKYLKNTFRLGIVLILMSVITSCISSNRPEDPAQQGQIILEKDQIIPVIVDNVIDGDTINVIMATGNEEKVRFIGVDTPESTRRQNEPYGEESSVYTNNRLEGKQVWLEIDAQERDRYGRLLAYIWMEKPVDNTEEEIRAKMFNAELLLNGYAQLMTVPPNVKYVDYFITLQQEARANNAGLWGLAREEPGEAYYVGSARSNKYHRPDCESGKQITPDNLIKFDTIDDALDAAYEPCRVCSP